MATLDEVMNVLDTILTRLDDIEAKIDSTQTTMSKSHLSEKVTEVLQHNPTIWFQPKTLIEHGVHANPQQIATPLKSLVARGKVEVEQKSVITGIDPEEGAYDPKLYRWKGTS